MYTLGINAAYHDSAACLVRDGQIVAAAEEERFTRIKHAKRPVPFSAYELPYHAIDYCLASQGITLADLEHVAYSYDPLLFSGAALPAETVELPLRPAERRAPEGTSSWDPLFLSYLVNAPRQLVDGAPHHLKKRFRSIDRAVPFRWHYVNHHVAHAASAFLPSPFPEAAVMTLDGRGERATTSYGFGRGSSIELLGQVDMPHSLGLLYEEVTEHLGFLRSSDEYKVMALAAFGKPAYEGQFRKMIELIEDGDYRIHHEKLTDLVGPSRERGDPLEQRHHDIACSLQAALENTVLQLAKWLHGRTGLDSLCMAGGVALNCVMNSTLRERGPFKNIWIQPAAGDAGTALGAALHVDTREQHRPDRISYMDNVFLGPAYTDDEVEEVLKRGRLIYRRLERKAEETADLLTRGAVVGWFQGRMEFGPRALGSRSILASPLDSAMQSRLNDIKDREDFRPVAPVVSEEDAVEWFDGGEVSPFMLFVYSVRKQKRELIPAVCHIDHSARIQTVNRSQHGDYYDLIKAFQQRTGVPVLINTSFNTRGKPIVCSPADAIECFYTSPLDALVLGPFLLQKRWG